MLPTHWSEDCNWCTTYSLKKPESAFRVKANTIWLGTVSDIFTTCHSGLSVEGIPRSLAIAGFYRNYYRLWLHPAGRMHSGHCLSNARDNFRLLSWAILTPQLVGADRKVIPHSSFVGGRYSVVAKRSRNGRITALPSLRTRGHLTLPTAIICSGYVINLVIGPARNDHMDGWWTFQQGQPADEAWDSYMDKSMPVE